MQPNRDGIYSQPGTFMTLDIGAIEYLTQIIFSLPDTLEDARPDVSRCVDSQDASSRKARIWSFSLVIAIFSCGSHKG